MKVKMLRSLAGLTVSYTVGREYDLDDSLAEAFVADGRAEPVESGDVEKPKARTRRQRTSAKPAGNVETRG